MSASTVASNCVGEKPVKESPLRYHLYLSPKDVDLKDLVSFFYSDFVQSEGQKTRGCSG